jgi:hypothetical protein
MAPDASARGAASIEGSPVILFAQATGAGGARGAAYNTTVVSRRRRHVNTPLSADRPQQQPRPAGAGRLYGLLLLDAFTIGGLVVILLVRQLLLDIMGRLISPTAQAEILNVLDHLLPYSLAYLGATLLLVLLTAGVYALRRRALQP